jgi:hypothetical protein
MGVIYLIRAGETEFAKIGYTSSPIGRRLKGLQTGNPLRLTVEATLVGDTSYEKLLHAAYHENRCEGEWFDCFSEIKTAFERIAAICNGVPVVPPRTSAGWQELQSFIAANGLRGKYPDGGELSHYEWDELEADDDFERWLAQGRAA